LEKVRGEAGFTLPPRPETRTRKEGVGRVRRIYIRRLTFIFKHALKAPLSPLFHRLPGLQQVIDGTVEGLEVQRFDEELADRDPVELIQPDEVREG